MDAKPKTSLPAFANADGSFGTQGLGDPHLRDLLLVFLFLEVTKKIHCSLWTCADLEEREKMSTSRNGHPVRQLSLQQLSKRKPVRRQRSAENVGKNSNSSLEIYANPIKNTDTGKDKPKVRVAWEETTKKTVKSPGPEKPPILYSRQELAERLRQAWKEREENKSNIDIFLARNAVVHSGMLESRSESSLSQEVEPEEQRQQQQQEVKDDTLAKLKRASFQSRKNKAFLDPIIDKREEKMPGSRNCSAPLLRRFHAHARTQVSITIDTSKTSEPGGESDNREDPSKAKNGVEAPAGGQGPGPPAIRPVRSAPIRRRAKSGSRRKGLPRDKSTNKRENGNGDFVKSDVVTMVSLISSAESDSDAEDIHSANDHKLIHQLRNKLPTMPIIKSYPTLVSARRPVKSVSFQQHSFDEEPHSEGPRDEKISPELSSSSWRTYNIPQLECPNSARKQQEEDDESFDSPLTDREKRCLVVPIGDFRDKKRKLFRSRSTPQGKSTEEFLEQQKVISKVQQDKKPEVPVTKCVKSNDDVPRQHEHSVPNSAMKLEEQREVSQPSKDASPEKVSSEPQLQTVKEKECWHLYKRMCDKGVCVSFDTVLRGMLTPTEYRLRQKERLQGETNSN